MTTATVPHPIYAQLRERAAAKQRAHDRKWLRDACKEMAAHMDNLGLAEIYKSEVPHGTSLRDCWIRIWNVLDDPAAPKETIEFTLKGVTYWLTRDI
jgi:hypothetical protein